MIKFYASKKKIWGKSNYFKKPSKELFESLNFEGEEFNEEKAIINGNEATLAFVGETSLIEYTYIKVITEDATYYFYKQSMGGLITEQSELNADGVEVIKRYFTHFFVIDTGNTYERDMLYILTNSDIKTFFVRKFCDRYILDETTITEKPGYYMNAKKQFWYSNPLPIKANLINAEMLTFDNDTILQNNGGNRNIGKTIQLEDVVSQSNADPNIIEYVKITYKLYAGTWGSNEATIYSYSNRSIIDDQNNIKLKIDFYAGGSKGGVSQIALQKVEIKIRNNVAVGDTEGKTFKIIQDTPTDKDTKYDVAVVGDSSRHMFYSSGGELKSYCLTRSNNKYTIEFDQPFNFADVQSDGVKYVMNISQFAESQHQDKNKSYYIIANQNVFNSNEAFATTADAGNLKNKNISYFIVPSMGNYSIDRIFTDGTKITLNISAEEWGKAIMNNEPYRLDGETPKYSPIVLNSNGIVNNIECSLPPEIICNGKGYIANQKIYDNQTGAIKDIQVPFVAFDYYNNKSTTNKLFNIDFSDLDAKTGTKYNEPYLLLSPQFINYNIYNKSNEMLTVPLGNYNLYLNDNGINAYIVTTDNVKLILDANNFNELSERSNIGDNFMVNMGNPVIFETNAFNNGYINSPTSEAMGRANFKDEQEMYNIETNMLNRDNNLSLGLGAFDAAGDFGTSLASGGKDVMEGAVETLINPSEGTTQMLKGGGKMLKGAKKFGESVAKLAVGQQDFRDKMKKRETQNGISFRNQENKYNSLRLAKNTINIGAYHTNALSNITDGILIYKTTPTPEVQDTIMNGIYEYAYSYNAVDSFASGKNRQLYNVIMLDLTYNYNNLYLYLQDNYNSIFNTKNNIDNFLLGLSGMIGILEVEPNELDNTKNIELTQPRYTETTIKDVYIDLGETVKIDYKIEYGGINITSNIIINSVELTGVIEQSYHIAYSGTDIYLIYDTLDGEGQQYDAKLDIEFEYGGKTFNTFAHFKLTTHLLEIQTDFSDMFFTKLTPTITRQLSINNNFDSSYTPLTGIDKDTGLEYYNGWCTTSDNADINAGVNDNGVLIVQGTKNSYVSSASIGIHCCYTDGLQTVYDQKYIHVNSEEIRYDIKTLTVGSDFIRLIFTGDFPQNPFGDAVITITLDNDDIITCTKALSGGGQVNGSGIYSSVLAQFMPSFNGDDFVGDKSTLTLTFNERRKVKELTYNTLTLNDTIYLE